jgi:UDP-N-acetylmuramoyl-tripeptide--D-alanyl-D-alanine ligase
MTKGIISLYSWRYPKAVVYMLQSSEYQVGPYLRWYWQTNDFSHVAYRRDLELTAPAKLLLVTLYIGMAAEYLLGLRYLWLWQAGHMVAGWEFGLALLLAAPVLWAELITVPLLLGRWLIVKPRQVMLVRQSERIFRQHKGVKIAITGSYGKTSMKEMLATVLSVGRIVAVTPGNKNVPISHAYFARRLTGKEAVLIIEYGEGGPGDVSRFAAVTHPTHVVITGLAPAHLNHYKTVEAAGQDIFSVAKVVKPQQVYVNAESPLTIPFIKKRFETYSAEGALGWQVSQVESTIHGISFDLKKATRVMHLTSGLVGRHQIGPLAFIAAFAAQLGMEISQIEEGESRTKPFEHRMQPYQLHGAWIIDDTYNGNIEGVRAGTALLAELTAKRRIYVTPGLVDQGGETKSVHEAMGTTIASAQPDIAVLMKNSVTDYIVDGLKAAGFKGEIIIEDDPLEFYRNLHLFVASGDVVLMQNDWPDNYA